MSIEGVLFDKDGTLLDFHATWMPAYRSAASIVARAAGQPQLADRLLTVGGFDHSSGRCMPGQPLASGTNLDLARLWAAECGIDDVAGLVEQLESIWAREAAPNAVLVGDVAGLLARLADRGLRLGVATMDSEALAHDTFARLSIDAFLDFVCGYDSGHGTKPGPGMVRAFCDHCALAPAQVMVVGDTLHDLRMGRNAGAGRVVGVLSGTADRATLEPHCDIVIDSVMTLESVIL